MSQKSIRCITRMLQELPAANTSTASSWIRRDACAYQSCYCTACSEENVYKLCQQLIAFGVPSDQLFACFISNPAKQIPIWKQGSSTRPDGLVVWDYHVILLQLTSPTLPAATTTLLSSSTSAAVAAATVTSSPLQPLQTSPPATSAAGTAGNSNRRSLHDQQAGSGSWVWDLDTQLSFPCPLKEYAARALRLDDMFCDGQTTGLPAELLRYYRIVPATHYLSHFSSDRRHMRRKVASNGIDLAVQGSDGTTQGMEQNNANPDSQGVQGREECSESEPHQEHEEDGYKLEEASEWLAPPPSWPCIQSQQAFYTHTLPMYWDVGPHNCVHVGGVGPNSVLNDGGSGCEHGKRLDWLGWVYDEHDFNSLCNCKS